MTKDRHLDLQEFLRNPRKWVEEAREELGPILIEGEGTRYILIDVGALEKEKKVVYSITDRESEDGRSGSLYNIGLYRETFSNLEEIPFDPTKDLEDELF